MQSKYCASAALNYQRHLLATSELHCSWCLPKTENQWKCVNVITIEIRKYYPSTLLVHSSQFRGFSESQILDNPSKLSKNLLQLHLLRLFFNGTCLECRVQEFVKNYNHQKSFFYFNNKRNKNLFIDVAVNSKLFWIINHGPGFVVWC